VTTGVCRTVITRGCALLYIDGDGVFAKKLWTKRPTLMLVDVLDSPEPESVSVSQSVSQFEAHSPSESFR